MKTYQEWLQGYTPSTHTLVGLLTALQAAYLTDADIQHAANRILGAHPVIHALCGYSLLVVALYRNGAAKNKNLNDKNQEMEQNNGK